MQYFMKPYTNTAMGNIRDNIVEHTCAYLVKYPNIKSLVIGLSGGADSALVSILSVLVSINMCKYHNRDITIIIRSLPIITNKQDEIDRAQNLGTVISEFINTVDFKEVDLSDLYTNIAFSFEKYESTPKTNENVRKGNIKARVRMIYLYNLASAHNGIVMSTDNYTEFLLGFWTLHGDVGDFGMIQNLWKTEVFRMLDFICVELENRYKQPTKLMDALLACRNAVPTDGLGISESDYAQFGDVSTYEEVDNILIDMLNNGYGGVIKKGGTIPKILTMYENTMYKRNNPYNIPRN